MSTRWAVKWIGGIGDSGLQWDGEFGSQFGSRPLLFDTRAKARAYIIAKWGYIRTREDLRRPPHNWRLPKPIKVEVILRPVSE